jgi:hypothetical protein
MNWKESVDEKQDFPRSADKFLKKAERKISWFSSALLLLEMKF